MKKQIFLIMLTCIVAKGFGQVVTDFSYPSSVDLFGLYEISFRLSPSYSNPYDPDTINIYAIFTDSNNDSFTVNAFYYEKYTFQQVDGYEVASHNTAHFDGWRIRFTPNTVGTWSFIIKAFDKNGELNLPLINVSHTFTCNSVNNANGFISNANSRFLKREVVKNGKRLYHSFFPIGPNVPWYKCVNYCNYETPKGIYYYEDHIDSLYGRANYMRIWINRYKYLSLYGPEYTQKVNNQPKIYFDSIVNQKDSAELDHIIAYASQHNIAIMVSFYNQNDFLANDGDHCNPDHWGNNPFNTIMNLSEPCDFFSEEEAVKITKNLIRYIISRWGYATNIMCWELWNEVEFAKRLCSSNGDYDQQILDWHTEMVNYIRNLDPFNHCISSSVGNPDYLPLFSYIFQNMDIVQQHNYQSIQNADSKFDLPYPIFIRTNSSHNTYPQKPFFMGEFGFSHSKFPHTEEKDPNGVALHNALWSSLFSTSIGPASLWWCYYLDSCALYQRFTPLMNFCANLSILSGTYTAHTTGYVTGYRKLVFPNCIETYYMINADEDTIMGWCQDTAFAYQSLRWLTDSVEMHYDTVWNGDTVKIFNFLDSVPPLDPNGYLYTLDPSKRPAPSSNSNVITLPIVNQSVGKRYKLQWFDSETGYPYNISTVGVPVQQDSQGNKFISFQFPSFIRDLKQNVIKNTFGDCVFTLIRYYDNPLQK